MQHDLRPIPHELPAYEVTAKVTCCENRFEILASPGREIDPWWAQAVLSRWLQGRVDATNPGGHNPANSSV